MRLRRGESPRWSCWSARLRGSNTITQPLTRSWCGTTYGRARLRLRPILMTSFAFIFGVLPLLVATGAGAEMRQALGTVVFYGMIGVTFFGLFLTPVFYTVIRKLVGDKPIIAPGK